MNIRLTLSNDEFKDLNLASSPKARMVEVPVIVSLISDKIKIAKPNSNEDNEGRAKSGSSYNNACIEKINR